MPREIEQPAHGHRAECWRQALRPGLSELKAQGWSASFHTDEEGLLVLRVGRR